MADPDQPAKRPRSRRIVIVVVAVTLALAGLIVAVVVSMDGSDGFADFQRSCLGGHGNSVVVLSSKTHGLAMGAPQTEYRLGCRQADGKIISTYNSNRP